MHIIKISFWRNKICCYLHYGKEVYPFPTFGNFKWQLIIDTAFNSINLLIIRIIPSENDRFMLVTFDFALFDKLFFFCANTLQQNGGRLIGRVLGNKFSLNSILEN